MSTQINNNLIENNRYLFTKEYLDVNKKKIKLSFRANFVKTIGNTIILTKLIKDNLKVFTSEKNCLHSIPIEWISEILTLNDITINKIKLPLSILFEIDKFL